MKKLYFGGGGLPFLRFNGEPEQVEGFVCKKWGIGYSFLFTIFGIQKV
jgi:hypothetical protein